MYKTLYYYASYYTLENNTIMAGVFILNEHGILISDSVEIFEIF